MSESERRICQQLGITPSEFLTYQSPARVALNAMSGTAKNKLLAVMKAAAQTEAVSGFITACKSLHLALNDFNRSIPEPMPMTKTTGAENEIIGRFRNVTRSEYMARRKEAGRVSLNAVIDDDVTSVELARNAILQAMASASDEDKFQSLCDKLNHQLIDVICARDEAALVSDVIPISDAEKTRRTARTLYDDGNAVVRVSDPDDVTSMFVRNESGRSMVCLPVR